MRFIIGSLFILTLVSLVFAEGDITAEMLKSFEKEIEADTHLPAILNAVSNNNAQELALNRSHVGQVDDQFAVKIETYNVTDQQSSGRCWLFTGLNVLRPKVIEKYNLEEFEFSQNYSFFWDQIEKANLFLQAVIETRDLEMDSRKVEWLFKNPIGDGGVWNNMVAVIEKYGVVPKSAMPESYNSSNTRTMNRVLRNKLREGGIRLRQAAADGAGLKDLQSMKADYLSDIYRILVIHLGQPPETFTWRYTDKDGTVSEPETFTPKQFYDEVVGLDLNDYVMLMNDPTNAYYKVYEIEWDRNVWSAPNWTFINLPTDELKPMAKASILGGDGMYFSCDVGKQLDRENGTLSLENYNYEALYGVEFNMTRKERVQTFQSGSSHGMNLVGVDTTAAGEPVKWLLENSWGKEAGADGFLVMTDEWFDEYMFRLVVHKKYIPEKILKIYAEKPTLLAPWDPMFVPMADH